MEISILFLGIFCSCVTAVLLYMFPLIFSRWGLSLVRTEPHTGLPGMMVEFSASVLISFSGSAALAFLFVGICSLLGVPIPTP
jgi:hypothetical protein